MRITIINCKHGESFQKDIGGNRLDGYYVDGLSVTHEHLHERACACLDNGCGIH